MAVSQGTESDHQYSSSQPTVKKCRITPSQKEIMVSFLENHPEMREKCLPLSATNRLWEELMKKLDEDCDPSDPSFRFFNNISEVKKCYSRLKRTILHKYMRAKEANKELTSFDRRVLTLVALDESTVDDIADSPIVKSFSDLKRTALLRLSKSKEVKESKDIFTNLDQRILKLSKHADEIEAANSTFVDNDNKSPSTDNNINKYSDSNTVTNMNGSYSGTNVRILKKYRPILPKTITKIRIQPAKLDDSEHVVSLLSDGDLEEMETNDDTESTTPKIGAVISIPEEVFHLSNQMEQEVVTIEDSTNHVTIVEATPDERIANVLEVVSENNDHSHNTTNITDKVNESGSSFSSNSLPLNEDNSSKLNEYNYPARELSITEKLKMLKEKELKESLRIRELPNSAKSNKASSLKRRRMRRDVLRRRLRNQADSEDNDLDLERNLLQFMEGMRDLEARKAESVRMLAIAVKDCCNQISKAFLNFSRASSVISEYYTMLHHKANQ
ncbi:hypothetical protein O3M35_005881 [Rhynocoris fuscipes]|uniref:Regulatory protein zeste n=1 Tax=Rhynocoris fuscipes TaxID=488301 RepID=A0AAW1DLX2_9HEMI